MLPHGVWSTTVQNTCIYCVYSSPSCWNFCSSGSSKMCIPCDIILITLFVALELRVFFLLIARVLFTCGASQCYVTVGFLCRKGVGLPRQAQISSCDCSLYWVSKCHDCWSYNFAIQWSCVPQSPLAACNLSFLSDECFASLSRLLNLGLLTNECLLLCESRF